MTGAQGARKKGLDAGLSPGYKKEIGNTGVVRNRDVCGYGQGGSLGSPIDFLYTQGSWKQGHCLVEHKGQGSL